MKVISFVILFYISLFGNDIVNELKEECNNNTANSCFSLGLSFCLGDTVWGIKKDIPKAKEYLKKTYSLGDLRGATYLGFIEEKNKNYKEAIKFYTLACDSGEMGGCGFLATMYTHGTGVQKDMVKALSLNEKSCKGGDIASCYNTGIMYYEGEVVPQNIIKAKELFKIACDGGAKKGCINYDILTERGN